MIELPEITKAWMGGFFDGEGGIWIGKRKPRRSTRGVSPVYYLSINVVNTIYSGVEPFQMYFGGNITLVRTKHRPIYRWTAQTTRAMRCLETLLPYLRVKQKQAELAILFRKKIRHHVGNAPMPEVYLAERERIRQAIQELNMGWPTPTVIDVTPKREQLALGIALAGALGEEVMNAAR